MCRGQMNTVADSGVPTMSSPDAESLPARKLSRSQRYREKNKLEVRAKDRLRKAAYVIP